MISIIVATKNRPQALRACITSIVKSSSNDFEIIVVDQSTSDDTKNLITTFQDRHISYIRDKPKGKSHALNIGLKHACGDICAFTDDDCIVSRQWIRTIVDSFARQKSVSAIFGQTKPYLQTKQPKTICPSVFFVSREHSIHKPCYHATHIGFGNNMAIRKSILNQIGGFRTWLGPGSLGLNAEDAEIALRLLIGNHVLYSNPKMLVFHNRWVAPPEARRQELLYASGEMACYCSFLFQGYAFADRIVLDIRKKETMRLQKTLAAAIHIPWRRGSIGALFWTIIVLIYRIWGTGIAWYFSKKEPLAMRPAITRANV